MINKKNCPVCKNNKLKILFTTTLPVLQNRVFSTKEKAKHSAQGNVTLTLCLNCKFVFNGKFDNKIIKYDKYYDNSVPSLVFFEYYNYIAKYIFEKYDLKNGTIYDIGCGKGTFLKQLCELYPLVNAVGIDPSYEGELNPAENLKFIVDVFKKDQVLDKPALIIVRHVFEHMEYPTDFLKAILNPLQKYNDIPIFIEVPDFKWIVQNQSFWDICYEHCNYFSNNSLAKLFAIDGCQINSISPAFKDQYLWAEGIVNALNEKFVSNGDNAVVYKQIEEHDIIHFTQSVTQLSTSITKKLVEAKQDGWAIIVWGMATKGVIFSNQVDANNSVIDYCIDVNKDKQEKFTPIASHKISAPEILNQLDKKKLMVIIMNPNYTDEIKSTVKLYNSNVIFIDAHGSKL